MKAMRASKKRLTIWILTRMVWSVLMISRTSSKTLQKMRMMDISLKEMEGN
jgi:hypothetical protein